MKRMSYIAVRREEEKERRRAEILDAAEVLYAKKGWDALTVDQVARSARLSRALVYVYFRDKEDLLFAIGERAELLPDAPTAADAVLSALENELARVEGEKSLAERIKPLQERVAKWPLTGLKADKAFFDDLSGEE